MKLWAFIAFFTVFFTAAGQQFPFQKISLEQGIPSNRVNDFLQDSRGFFWIATEGAGLVLYDGFEFKTIDFGLSKLKPFVSDIQEDDAGNIWSASDHVLIRYDGRNFKYYYLPDPHGRISNILINENDEIYVTGDRTVYKLLQGDTLSAVSVSSNSVINDAAFYEGELWMASDSGLYMSDKLILKGKWTDLQKADKALFTCGPAGIFKFDKNGKKVISTDGSEYLCHRQGKILAVGIDFLQIITKEEILKIGTENGLPKEDFKGCYLEQSGVIWLYSNNGLTKLESTSIRFYNNNEGVEKEVLSVMISDGSVMYSASVDGLSFINKEGIQTFNNTGFGVILAIAEYDGYTWLGTERGLIRFDGSSFKEIRLPGSVGGYIFSLKGTEDALWIGTGNGIFMISNGRVVNISSRENMPRALIYAISEGDDGSLWFATYFDGFVLRSANGWQNVHKLGEIRLDSMRFNTMAAVNANEIWAGTLSEGLYHITGKNYENIPPNQLHFAEVRSLRLDHNNDLWMGSNKGLAKIVSTKDGYSVKTVGRLNQFLDEGFTPQALDVKNGYLLAGTSEGVLTIDLENFERNVAPPPLYITNVELSFGEVTGLEDYAEDIKPFSNVPLNLELPHDLNFLNFTLAGLTGYQPENLVYRYRMKGQANNWTLAGSRREAVFSNLRPGNYIFEAQVTREGEEWGESAIAYKFKIQSPLWLRWWFIVLVCIIVGSITFKVLADRVKRINQRLRLENSLLDMERKALRLQMNPHFIFNALDSISSFIFKNEPKQAVRYLNNFAKLMRLTLESSMEHLHPVEAEVSVLKNYLELEKLRFGDKFDYEIVVDEAIDYDVGIPPMLIQPHVENAILHGLKPKAEKGFLSIRFKLEGDLLICEVEDDGIGRKRAKEIPKRKDHRSMATEINRDRLRILKLSKGDEIDFEIIDKENPTGTKVVIKLPAENI